MKIIKTFLLSTLFLILLLPASCSTIWSVNEILGRNTYDNPAFKDSPFYTTNDEIGFVTDYCKKNNYFGRTGTEEEKLRKCISGELRNQSLAWMLDGFMFYFSLIVIPIFLLYLYFYYKWLRKNYFNKI
jgi:hypothetical protein